MFPWQQQFHDENETSGPQNRVTPPDPRILDFNIPPPDRGAMMTQSTGPNTEVLVQEMRNIFRSGMRGMVPPSQTNTQNRIPPPLYNSVMRTNLMTNHPRGPPPLLNAALRQSVNTTRQPPPAHSNNIPQSLPMSLSHLHSDMSIPPVMQSVRNRHSGGNTIRVTNPFETEPVNRSSPPTDVITSRNRRSMGSTSNPCTDNRIPPMYSGMQNPNPMIDPHNLPPGLQHNPRFPVMDPRMIHPAFYQPSFPLPSHLRPELQHQLHARMTTPFDHGNAFSKFNILPTQSTLLRETPPTTVENIVASDKEIMGKWYKPPDENKPLPDKRKSRDNIIRNDLKNEKNDDVRFGDLVTEIVKQECDEGDQRIHRPCKQVTHSSLESVVHKLTQKSDHSGPLISPISSVASQFPVVPDTNDNSIIEEVNQQGLELPANTVKEVEPVDTTDVGKQLNSDGIGLCILNSYSLASEDSNSGNDVHSDQIDHSSSKKGMKCSTPKKVPPLKIKLPFIGSGKRKAFGKIWRPNSSPLKKSQRKKCFEIRKPTAFTLEKLKESSLDLAKKTSENQKRPETSEKTLLDKMESKDDKDVLYANQQKSSKAEKSLNDVVNKVKQRRRRRRSAVLLDASGNVQVECDENRSVPYKIDIGSSTVNNHCSNKQDRNYKNNIAQRDQAIKNNTESENVNDKTSSLKNGQSDKTHDKVINADTETSSNNQDDHVNKVEKNREFIEKNWSQIEAKLKLVEPHMKNKSPIKKDSHTSTVNESNATYQKHNIKRKSNELIETSPKDKGGNGSINKKRRIENEKQTSNKMDAKPKSPSKNKGRAACLKSSLLVKSSELSNASSTGQVDKESQSEGSENLTRKRKLTSQKPESIASKIQKKDHNTKNISCGKDKRLNAEDQERTERCNDITRLISSITHPAFFVTFHGKRVLCLHSTSGKLLLMRELLRRNFRELVCKDSTMNCMMQVQFKNVYLAKERDLKIGYREIPGEHKTLAVKYLIAEKLLKSQKAPAHLGVITVDDALRLYHYMNGLKKCPENCIEIWSPENSSETVTQNEDFNEAETQNEENKQKQKHAKTKSPKKTRQSPSKRKLLSENTKNSTIKVVESKHNNEIEIKSKEKDGYESDETIVYEDESSEQNNSGSSHSNDNTESKGEEDVDSKIVLRGGVAECYGSYFRYIVVEGEKFYPYEDLVLKFGKIALTTALQSRLPEKFRAYKCTEVEADFINKLEESLPVLNIEATLLEEALFKQVANSKEIFQGNSIVDLTENDEDDEVHVIEPDEKNTENDGYLRNQNCQGTSPKNSEESSNQAYVEEHEYEGDMNDLDDSIMEISLDSPVSEDEHISDNIETTTEDENLNGSDKCDAQRNSVEKIVDTESQITVLPKAVNDSDSSDERSCGQNMESATDGNDNVKAACDSTSHIGILGELSSNILTKCLEANNNDGDSNMPSSAASLRNNVFAEQLSSMLAEFESQLQGEGELSTEEEIAKVSDMQKTIEEAMNDLARDLSKDSNDSRSDPLRQVLAVCMESYNNSRHHMVDTFMKMWKQGVLYRAKFSALEKELNAFRSGTQKTIDTCEKYEEMLSKLKESIKDKK